MGITLNMSLEIISAARDAATNLGVPMVISVVDQGGNLVALQRMDEALLVSVDVSMNKAYTAVAVKVPTEALATAAAPGGELFGLHVADNSRIVIFGGGIPLVVDGKVVGGVGISGGSVKQDVICAKTAVEKFEQLS